VTITAYRISRKQYAKTMWSGMGARVYGARWNSKGVAVAYAAENRSLAAVEQLVHLIKPPVLRGFVIASITFDDSQVQRVDPRALPKGWDAAVAPASLRKHGDRWVAAGRYAVLAVPSAVTAGEWNYLINPLHADFAGMKKSKPAAFIYDSRLG
jgi:RES domain-containing protein